MDLSKQYPELPLGPRNDGVFDVERLLARLGLSLVDLIRLSRGCSRHTAESLGARAGVPPEEVLRLVGSARRLFGARLAARPPGVDRASIPTGLAGLDRGLRGGVPLGQITEVFGASGSGKSQFLLALAVQAQRGGGHGHGTAHQTTHQTLNETANETANETTPETANTAHNHTNNHTNNHAHNHANPTAHNDTNPTAHNDTNPTACIYISTEAPLASRRLSDFGGAGALERVAYIYCPDLETQDHILFTQLRLKLEENRRRGVATAAVFVDSVGHHLRAEDACLDTLQFLRGHVAWQERRLAHVPAYGQHKARFAGVTGRFLQGGARFRSRAARQHYLYTMYRHLGALARAYNVAVVLANQVSDVMDAADAGRGAAGAGPLAYDFQLGAFLGWGAGRAVAGAGASGGAGASARGVAGAGASERGPPPASAGQHPTAPANTSQHPTAAGTKKPAAAAGHAHTAPGPEQAPRPPKVVPALGYTWTKLATHRILLWKTYQGGPGAEAPGGLGPRVRRFARAVLALALGAATAEFEISQTGLAAPRT